MCFWRLTTTGIVLSLLATQAYALDAKTINDAQYADNNNKTRRTIDPLIIKAQILLDRARFSPGEIDGKFGENVEKALRAFTEANGLPSSNKLTTDNWNKLVSTSSSAVLVSYVVTTDDLKGPFLQRQPASMEAMKDLKALGYRSVKERLSEKFHLSEELLAELNPKSSFSKEGETIIVADVKTSDSKQTAARLDVDKTLQTIKAYSSGGELLGFFPASVGSEEKPTPSGTLKVQAVQPNPVYRYNPDYKFKTVKTKKPFSINPGPNNPVGSMWIKLSGDGYGIHGTSDPSKVSKSESHGCVRLTNWDALRVAQLVKRGTPVNFTGE